MNSSIIIQLRLLMPEGDAFKYMEAEMVPSVYPYVWDRTPWTNTRGAIFNVLWKIRAYRYYLLNFAGSPCSRDRMMVGFTPLKL